MATKADITIHSAEAGARGMHQECCDRGDILMFLTRQRIKSYITKGFVLEAQGRVSPMARDAPRVHIVLTCLLYPVLYVNIYKKKTV